MTTETQFGLYTQVQVDEMLAEVTAEAEEAIDTQRAMCFIGALLFSLCGAVMGGAIGFALGWWLA